jgi:solute carrier family 66 (lysosomal lysine-arginine transporter), member 1
MLTPNIVKNIKTGCEGLSPALFFFSILGNTTYALSICAKSMDKAYLMTNAGWLAGECDPGIPHGLP